MEKLSTIQKREKLNEVDEIEKENTHHRYNIAIVGTGNTHHRCGIAIAETEKTLFQIYV